MTSDVLGVFLTYLPTLIFTTYVVSLFCKIRPTYLVIYQILPGSMRQWHKLFPIPDHETRQSFAQERSLLELHPWITRKISDLGIIISKGNILAFWTSALFSKFSINTSLDSARAYHPFGKAGGIFPWNLVFLNRLMISRFFAVPLRWANPTLSQSNRTRFIGKIQIHITT